MAIFESIVPEEIKKSIAEEQYHIANEWEEYRQYLIDFYECSQTDKDEYLRSWGFKDNTFIPESTTHLTKRVINQVSLVYKKPPERKLMDKEGNELKEQGYEDFIDAYPDFNVSMKYVERYYMLLENILFRPVYSEADKRLYFWIETSYIPHFTIENNLTPFGYSIPLKINKNNAEDKEQWFLFISKPLESIAGQYYFHNDKGDIRYDDNYPTGEHPFKRIPLIDFSNFPVNDYWQMGARSLVDGNRDLNWLWMNLKAGIHFQMFDKPWIVNPQRSPGAKGKETIKWDPWTMLELDDAGTAGVLGFNPKILEVVESIKFGVNLWLQDYGLRAHWADSGQIASGVALKITNLELMDNRQDALAIFRSKENEIFDVIKELNDYHSLGFKIKEDAVLQTDFVEPEFPKEPAEERAQHDWELQKGYTSKEKYLIEQNPDLTEEEAQKMIDDNLMSNRRGRGLITSLIPEEEEIEPNGQF